VAAAKPTRPKLQKVRLVSQVAEANETAAAAATTTTDERRSKEKKVSKAKNRNQPKTEIV
jgi:hypothetical protein